MPRRITIAIESHRTDAVLGEIHRLPALFGLSVQRGTSLKPKGDVITVIVGNEGIHVLMRLPSLRNAGKDPV